MEHKKFSNMYIFHVQTFWLSGFRDKWFYISHAYVYIIIFYKHSISWHSQVRRIDLNRLIDFTSVTKQAICRASRRTSESICTVRLFPLFQVVSSGKGSKIRKQTLECCVCREGMASLGCPSWERTAWRAGPRWCLESGSPGTVYNIYKGKTLFGSTAHCT